MRAYELMHKIYYSRFKLFNPSIMQIVLEEKVFYDNISSIFKKADKLDMKVTELDKKSKIPECNYDPCKYIRGGKIVQAEDEEIRTKTVKSIANLDKRKRPDPEDDDDFNWQKKPSRQTQPQPPTNDIANFTYKQQQEESKPQNRGYTNNYNQQPPIEMRSQPSKTITQAPKQAFNEVLIRNDTVYEYDFGGNTKNQVSHSFSNQFDEFDNQFSSLNTKVNTVNDFIGNQNQNKLPSYGQVQQLSRIAQDPFEELINEAHNNFGFQGNQKSNTNIQHGYSFDFQKLNRNTVAAKKVSSNKNDDLFKDFY